MNKKVGIKQELLNEAGLTGPARLAAQNFYLKALGLFEEGSVAIGTSGRSGVIVMRVFTSQEKALEVEFHEGGTVYVVPQEGNAMLSSASLPDALKALEELE